MGFQVVVESEGIALRARISRARVSHWIQLRSAGGSAEQSRRTLQELRKGVAIKESQLVAEEVVGAYVDGVSVKCIRGAARVVWVGE